MPPKFGWNRRPTDCEIHKRNARAKDFPMRGCLWVCNLLRPRFPREGSTISFESSSTSTSCHKAVTASQEGWSNYFPPKFRDVNLKVLGRERNLWEQITEPGKNSLDVRCIYSSYIGLICHRRSWPQDRSLPSLLSLCRSLSCFLISSLIRAQILGIPGFRYRTCEDVAVSAFRPFLVLFSNCNLFPKSKIAI